VSQTLGIKVSAIVSVQKISTFIKGGLLLKIKKELIQLYIKATTYLCINAFFEIYRQLNLIL